MFYNYNGVKVSNSCNSSIKGYHEIIQNGRVTISDKSQKLKTIITVKNKEIHTQRIILNGKTAYSCQYGKAEKEKGRYTLRFRSGTFRGHDGLSVRHDQEIFGYKGTVKTFYIRGRLLWQKFYFKGTRKLCYYLRPHKPSLLIKYPNGKPLYIFEGQIDCRNKPEGYVVWNNQAHYSWREDKLDWSKDGNCSFIKYDKKGEITLKGQFQNKQRVGDWIEKNEKAYYLQGHKVSAAIYNTPPEKLKVKSVLAIKDTDIRSIFINRIGLERVVKEGKGKIVHKQNGKQLIRLPLPIHSHNDPHFQILQVTCPSTKQKYFLQVPPDIRKCEQARQWTFGVSNLNQRIHFEVET